MNNLSLTKKVMIGAVALLVAIFAFSEEARQSYSQSYNESYNDAREGWVQGPNGRGTNQQVQCPPGTLPAVGPGSQGGCAPIPGGQYVNQGPSQYPNQGPNQYPNQYPNQGPNQYPNQYPNQGPNQYPNQYPNQGPNQYPNQYPNQGPNQYPNQYPNQGPNQYPQNDGYYMDSGEVDLGPQTEADDEW